MSGIRAWLTWVLGVAHLGRVLQGLTSCNQVTGQDWSLIWGSTGKGYTPKLMSLLQDLFLVPVGYQPEVSSVLWHMTSLNGCLLHKIQQVWSSVESASKMEITVLFNIITEVTSITFVVFYCLETSCRSCPHSKGNGLHVGMNVRRQRWFGTILEPVSHCLPLQIFSSYL